MDCTGSMGSYIISARDNIRKIVDEIVASEKSDVRLALVEYRDHPPQDNSFVTKTHVCTASGGGDMPEAVADALHNVLKLSWRKKATKICVCISDAPPHGLNLCEDGFPKGCPAGIDPMEVTNKMAEKGITLYMAGCEPSIIPYKDFFMALAFITGGQYVPLRKAQLLTQVIVGGAQEEMSLEQFMHEVNEEAQADIAAGRDINEEDFTRRVHHKMLYKGIQTQQMMQNNVELQTATDVPRAMNVVNSSSMAEVRKHFKPLPFVPSGVFSAMASGSARGVKRPLGSDGDSVPPSGSARGVKRPLGSDGDSVPPSGSARGVKRPLGSDGDSVPPPGSASGGLLPPRTAEDDNINVMRMAISYGQSSRMVQKCMKRNFLK